MKEYKSSFKGRDFRGSSKNELRKLDFGKADLRGANFMGCQHLYGMDFSGANIYGANFENTNICGANFRSIENHEDDDLCEDSSDSNKPDIVNFRGANICGANFKNANLCKADFSNAKTDYLQWWNTTIKASMLVLSILSALVIFHSFDIIQVFLFQAEDLNNVGLETTILHMTDAVLSEEGAASTVWNEDTIQVAERVRANFVPETKGDSDAITLANEIKNKCTYSREEADKNFSSTDPFDACGAADYFIELVEPSPFNVKPVAIFALLSAVTVCTILFLNTNANLLGIVLLVINVSIALAAIGEASLSIPIFLGLIALSGLVSGLLIQAISTALGIASEISRWERKFIDIVRWFASILAMLFLALYLLEPDEVGSRVGLPLIFSIILLALGSYIGRKSIEGGEKISFNSFDSNGEKASLKFERYFILEFLTIQLLHLGPMTSFWGAQLQGVNFKGIKLKKYLTLMGGRDYDDETLGSILWLMGERYYDDEILESLLQLGKEEERKRIYEDITRRSITLGNSFWYGNILLSAGINHMQEILILGSISNTGIMNFGEIVGNVINSLSNSPLQKGMDFRIDESLINLLHTIRSTEEMSNEDKFKALKQLEKFAKTLQVKD